MAQVYDLGSRTGGKTIKQIGIHEVVQDALDNNINTVILISSGNYLDAFLEEMQRRGVTDKLGVINLVNRTKGKPELELLIEDNKVLGNAKERELYAAERVPDIGKVKDYTDYIPRKLEDEADRILAPNPEYVSVGVGTGKLFISLYRKIMERGLTTKLIGVVPKGENGIYNDNNLYKEKGNLYFKKFKPKSKADKLTAPYTFYRDEILKTLADGHILIEAKNRDFKRANRKAKKEGYETGISGSAGFIALEKKLQRQYGIRNNADILVVNTGRGLTDKTASEVQKQELQKRFYRPLAATVIALLLGLNVVHNTAKLQQHNLQRESAMPAAKIAERSAKRQGLPTSDPNKMTTSELHDYIEKAKEWMGGPPHYW